MSSNSNNVDDGDEPPSNNKEQQSQNNDHHHPPGQGWSNGDIEPQLLASTRSGKLQLYGTQRRWIGLAEGWTRITAGTTEMDKRHSISQTITTDDVSHTTDPDTEARTVRCLLAQLCEKFYHMGWATGTGGGLSIRVGDGSADKPFRVFVAPSGLQKEDMIGNDMFELDMQRNIVHAPKTPNLRQSACTPLWYVVYKYHSSARCVIHTHSRWAVLATLLDPSESSDCLTLTHLEMLKGVGHHSYDDILHIPIIDNRPSEDLLAAQLESAIQRYPKSNAVLVRRHGVYVWGDSWEQAKTQCESFDYLFQCAVEMKQMMNIDVAIKPKSGTYREDDEQDQKEPATKKSKTTGFHGSAAIDNTADLSSNTVPIIPRDSKILLLDIEGCTTSISFVKDTLFPYVLKHLDDSLAKNPIDIDLQHKLRTEVLEAWDMPGVEPTHSVGQYVEWLMQRDIKSAGLKELQGQMWEAGYKSGELKGHVYSDFHPMLEWMKSKSVPVYIYSSGSIKAQLLLFGHSVAGDLTSMLAGHFDIPSAGNKKEAASYRKIASGLGVHPSSIVFVSDAEAELVAAKEAGIGYPVMSIRPGNTPLTDDGKAFPAVYSLLQLCGE